VEGQWGCGGAEDSGSAYWRERYYVFQCFDNVIRHVAFEARTERGADADFQSIDGHPSPIVRGKAKWQQAGPARCSGLKRIAASLKICPARVPVWCALSRAPRQ